MPRIKVPFLRGVPYGAPRFGLMGAVFEPAVYGQLFDIGK
jgi:hypothetical protein